MIRVLHIITTLGPAGAETMLCRLASAMDRSHFENEIISLTPILDLADRMQAANVCVRTLGMKVGMPNPLLVMRLAQWIRDCRPDVIHTWMYHANLVGGIAARLAGNVPVIWGIHHSVLDPRADKRRTFWVNRACALLSQSLSARIVCCSEASLRSHKNAGYAADKLEVIRNGVDLEQLKPDPHARTAVREELGIPANALLIGMAARFHPYKDHQNFLRAAAQLYKRFPDVHFLLCGLDITPQNAHLAEWIEAAGITSRCHLLGVREDMGRIFAALDVAVSASISEAFPVAVCEAMACGTPCVVTDVGDSAAIVQRAGVVVPPGNSRALSGALRQLIEAGREVRLRMGMAARRRVQEHFALATVVERYQAIYLQLAVGKPTSAVSASLSHCAR
jgi:glycosyltransferase involved in cell wall biosynthesis